MKIQNLQINKRYGKILKKVRKRFKNIEKKWNY
jgi:hypothetical protein